MTYCLIILWTIFLTSMGNVVSEDIHLGSNCAIVDPINQNHYDFTQLSSAVEEHVIVHEHTGRTVRLRLCSALPNRCGGEDGYSICLKDKNNEERGIGKTEPRLEYVSGRLQFIFTGDTCQPDKNYTVHLIMSCDYSATNNSHPEMFTNHEDECSFTMIWTTSAACGQRKQYNCTVVDRSGHHYNLSSLTSFTKNYDVQNVRDKLKVAINVCHSVIFGYGSTCQRVPGVCLQNSTDASNIKYQNWGEEMIPLYFENGTLKIRYQDGDMCRSTSDSLAHHQTTISFICDPEATNTGPESVNGTDCDHKFEWKTVLACNKVTLRDYNLANARRCKVTDPLSKLTFNLQSLMKTNFAVVSNSIEYKLRICQAYDGTCQSGTGVCSTKNATSAGMANSDLKWMQGGPYLNYTDGDACGNGQQRHTMIGFVCGEAESFSGPLIIKDEPCDLIIHFYTDLVCERRINCTVGNDTISLKQLMRSADNYVVKAHGKEFHINVCRPLVPTQGLTCPHGSAVCEIVRDSKGQFTNGTSLGFPEISEIRDDNGNATLHYSHSSPCPGQPENTITSSFKFFCDYNAGVGLPEYKSYENCHYIFHWKTSVVCGAVVGEWAPPCTIKNPLTSHELDLSVLYKKRVHYVKSKQGKEYSVSICGGEQHCNGSAVCRGSNGYGNLPNVNFDYSRNMIKLMYSKGAECFGSSYASQLWLMCNTTVGIGEPTLRLELNCSAEFEWHTSVACGLQEEGGISFPSPVTETDLKESQEIAPVQVGVVIGVLLLMSIVVGALLLYLRSPRRRAHLRSCVKSITSSRNNNRVQYSRVNTTEEARLLLDSSDPAHCQTDSDDELLGA